MKARCTSDKIDAVESLWSRRVVRKEVGGSERELLKEGSTIFPTGDAVTSNGQAPTGNSGRKGEKRKEGEARRRAERRGEDNAGLQQNRPSCLATGRGETTKPFEARQQTRSTKSKYERKKLENKEGECVIGTGKAKASSSLKSELIGSQLRCDREVLRRRGGGSCREGETRRGTHPRK